MATTCLFIILMLSSACLRNLDVENPARDQPTNPGTAQEMYGFTLAVAAIRSFLQHDRKVDIGRRRARTTGATKVGFRNLDFAGY